MIQPGTYNYSYKSYPKKKVLLKTLLLVVLGSYLFVACSNINVHGEPTSKELRRVRVGDQVWAATNLDVVTFRNGDSISEVTSNEEWAKAGKERRPAWCYYQNDAVSSKTFGRLYNWFAINDPRGLCPEGWRVPTNEEWIALENHLGAAEAGQQLKCTEGWQDNGNGNNSSGLCLLPGGYRGRVGGFSGVGEFLYLSSSTEGKTDDANEEEYGIWGRGVQFESKGIMRCLLNKEFGLYVRCIKDRP